VTVFLAVFGTFFVFLGLFISQFPERYLAWRRSRQPQFARLFERPPASDDLRQTRMMGWLQLCLGFVLMIVAVMRTAPASWYIPGVLVLSVLGIVFTALVAVVSWPLSTPRDRPSQEELQEIVDRLGAVQGLSTKKLSPADFHAAMAQFDELEEKRRRGSRVFGVPVNWPKVWVAVLVVCGLAGILGRVTYPAAADHFGYALPGDAFADLPGHVTYDGHLYTNPGLCDSKSCPSRLEPACYSAHDLQRGGTWPLVQVTGIPSLPGPMRQVYAPAGARALPTNLYVLARDCYVTYVRSS
jgi:hypothetical protein